MSATGPQQGRFGIVFASQIDADVSDAAFRLFVRLTSYADKEGRCWPSVATLARASNVQQRQIYKLLQELSDAGLIVREPQYRKDGSQCSSTTWIPVRAGQESLSHQDRGDWSVQTVLEQTSRTDQRTDQFTITGPSGPGGDPEVEMGIVGAWDEDAEMPEGGAPPPRKKKPFEEAKKRGTHGWVLERFEAERSKAKVGTTRYNRGHLNRLLKSLRDDDGMTNEEIVVLIEIFFVRHGRHIQTKAKEIDLVRIFQQMIPQLQKQGVDTLRATRDGKKTTTARGRELNVALKERLMQGTERNT